MFAFVRLSESPLPTPATPCTLCLLWWYDDTVTRGRGHHICVNCTLLRLQTRGSHMTQNTAKWISGPAQPAWCKVHKRQDLDNAYFPRTGSSSELEGAPLIIIGGMFKVGSKARTSWWSVCGQLWPGTQLPVLALSCAELPLSSPRPGPATLGTHSCLDCWLLAWHRCDIISPATTYYTYIPSLPFPTSGNTKLNLSEKLAYIGTQGQSQCMWCWQQWDSQWDQERPDRPIMSNWHGRNTGRTTQERKHLCHCWPVWFFRVCYISLASSWRNKWEMSWSEEIW